MLLRFRVSNHLSLRDEQELSLVASSLKDNEEGLIDCPPAPGGKALPAAIIYGANASGKSNVLHAMNYMREAVLYSYSRKEPDDPIVRYPFALDPDFADKPSFFSVEFILDNILHEYAFKCNNFAFIEEYIYIYPKGRRQILFERAGDEFVFGRNFKGANNALAEVTRPNSLFLSAARQSKHEPLSRIADFFKYVGRSTSISADPHELNMNLLSRQNDERVTSFLKKMNTGIDGIDIVEVDSPASSKLFAQKLNDLFKQSFDIDLGETLLYENFKNKTMVKHKNIDGDTVVFELTRESAGTRRLLAFLGPIFNTVDAGAIFLLDELDASLHTQACEAILALFSSPKTNPKGAQLIATTHDTNLLRSPLLRRDQIWFTEKDDEGATHLYPLTDIRTRKGDNIEKGYLQGRYGAVPFSGSVADLIREL